MSGGPSSALLYILRSGQLVLEWREIQVFIHVVIIYILLPLEFFFLNVFGSITILYSFRFPILPDQSGRGVRGSLKLVLAVCLGQVPCPSGRGFTSLFQWLALRCCSRLHLQFIRFYYFVFTSCHYCVVLQLVKSKKKHTLPWTYVLYNFFYFFIFLFYSVSLNEETRFCYSKWSFFGAISCMMSKSEIVRNQIKIGNNSWWLKNCLVVISRSSRVLIFQILCSYRCIIGWFLRIVLDFLETVSNYLVRLFIGSVVCAFADLKTRWDWWTILFIPYLKLSVDP